MIVVWTHSLLLIYLKWKWWL